MRGIGTLIPPVAHGRTARIACSWVALEELELPIGGIEPIAPEELGFADPTGRFSAPSRFGERGR